MLRGQRSRCNGVHFGSLGQIDLADDATANTLCMPAEMHHRGTSSCPGRSCLESLAPPPHSHLIVKLRA